MSNLIKINFYQKFYNKKSHKNYLYLRQEIYFHVYEIHLTLNIILNIHEVNRYPYFQKIYLLFSIIIVKALHLKYPSGSRPLNNFLVEFMSVTFLNLVLYITPKAFSNSFYIL